MKLRVLRLSLCLLAVHLLSACSVLHRAPMPEQSATAGMHHNTMTVAPEEIPMSVRNGSIYAANQDIRLFEDLRASRAGDIITIVLAERTDARKSASTSTSKDEDVTLPGPTLGGRPITQEGIELLNAIFAGSRSFDGEGDSSQSNSLTGSVTVTVSEVLPNGNLAIAGEKWITINQGREFVRISGIVRPYDILPDNSVTSDKVANAQIAYGGKGVIADANTPGWLSRFFSSRWFPF